MARSSVDSGQALQKPKPSVSYHCLPSFEHQFLLLTERLRRFHPTVRSEQSSVGSAFIYGSFFDRLLRKILRDSIFRGGENRGSCLIINREVDVGSHQVRVVCRDLIHVDSLYPYISHQIIGHVQSGGARFCIMALRRLHPSSVSWRSDKSAIKWHKPETYPNLKLAGR